MSVDGLPFTPEITPTEFLCRRVSIPDDFWFTAALVGAITKLTVEDAWDDTDGIPAWEAQALASEFLYQLFDTECLIPGTGGAMELIEHYTISNNAIINLPFPADDFRYVRIIGTIGVLGTTAKDLRARLSGDESAGSYSLLRNTTTSSATSGTNTTDSFAECGWPAHNALPSESDNPPYAQIDFTIFDPALAQKTLVEHTYYSPSVPAVYRCNWIHNVAQSETYLTLFNDGGLGMDADITIYGLRKNDQ